MNTNKNLSAHGGGGGGFHGGFGHGGLHGISPIYPYFFPEYEEPYYEDEEEEEEPDNDTEYKIIRVPVRRKRPLMRRGQPLGDVERGAGMQEW